MIKTFPNARVGFSINTLDERFKDDMDKAVSIERRIAAMKTVPDAGVRTACFISPIFPEITDVPVIIDKVKSQCNLIWIENLNLKGSYRLVIMEYIKTSYPNLVSLYEEIYIHNNRRYWEELDQTMKKYAFDHDLVYLRNDDSMERPFDALPVIVNFFYHDEIKKSAQKRKKT